MGKKKLKEMNNGSRDEGQRIVGAGILALKIEAGST